MPAELLAVKWIDALLALHGNGCGVSSKEYFMKTQNPNMKIKAKLDLQHIIHIFSIFGGVDKAARVDRIWSLIET
jgi:hypothetical protein